MKKILAFVASMVYGLSVFAANTISTNIATTSSAFILQGDVAVSYITLSSPDTNTAACVVYDSPGNWIAQTNAAYYTITSFATNYITTWTNFYGATNNLTNVVLYTGITTNSATTNAMTPKLSLSTAAGTSSQFSGINMVFRSGICITNTGAGTIGVTIGYVR